MREANVSRETSETRIQIAINIDGTGVNSIHTGIPFFDHMLTAFSKHGRFDLSVCADGDIQVSPHHTVEDVALVLGMAFDQALADCKGIRRFSHTIVPMDESRAMVAVDISRRPYCVFSAPLSGMIEGVFSSDLIEHFFRSFVSTARITMHIEGTGISGHHLAEALFKGSGIAIHDATRIVDPNGRVPSTKNVL